MTGKPAIVQEGDPLSDLIEVVDSRGRTLSPCRRQVAEREVRLKRAKWVGRNRIRLRFDPYAYRYLRLKVLARDKYVCYWCGAAGNTIDHILPWSKGGRTTMTNCVTACQECNGQRGDTPAEQFAQFKGVVVPQFTGNEQIPRIAVRPKGAVHPTSVVQLAATAPAAERPATARSQQPGTAAVPIQIPVATAAPEPEIPEPTPELTAPQRAERLLLIARLLEGNLSRRSFL